MNCPNDGHKLEKLGISLVCPVCYYKIYQPEKKVYPELGHTLRFPEFKSWDEFTLSSVSVTDNTISLTSGATSGTAISPKLINLTTSLDKYKKDVTKVLISSLVGAKEEGKITLHASNDGGTTWIGINDDNQEWELNYGNEAASGVSEQLYYYDLRFKITLSRTDGAKTSPYIKSMVVEHNILPETRRIKKRENLTKLMIGG
jgi:hypothetical protein